jgi:hypothetical protein
MHTELAAVPNSLYHVARANRVIAVVRRHRERASQFGGSNRCKMWTFPNCDRTNDAHFDLCEHCGCNTSGEVDKIVRFVARLRKWALVLLCLLPTIYVASYFLLSSHSSGTTFSWSGATSKQYTYHDRGFPFDPWVFQPLARVEYWIRGSDSQVVNLDGRYRGGQPIYGFGPFE